ncbi:MAG: hypothetical protein R3D01_00695 [Hyphomicrobiales bacterium]
MAGEQLVMPFTCATQGGNVSLAPSAPQAYDIYGSKETKRLKTCSPLDPKRCHHWQILRFDVDCGGVRTSWQSIVTAMAPILAESSRSLEPPGSGPGPYDGPAGARQLPHGAGPAIRFPPGFAPNPLKVASFKRVADAPPQVALPAKKPVPPPSETAANEPSQAPAAVPAAPTDNAPSVANASPEQPETTKVATREPLQIEVVNGNPETTGSLPKSNTGSSLWQDAVTGFTVTLAVLLAMSAFLLLRRRKVQTLALAVAEFPHEPATPSPLARAANSGLDQTAVEPQGESRLRLWDEDWLPMTVSEALDVLGVDPEASRDVMKTTVTRLRRALHPDHAIDEEDRRLRERRLKQINVAWDIVSGKRRAHWLSVKSRSA